MLTSVVVRLDGLMGVIDALDRAGYDVWAPAIRDGVLVTRRFQDGDELPVGYVSDQSPGAYELVPTSDRSRFGWAVGPQPWKPLLHPASVTTMTMTQPDSASTVAVAVASRQHKPLALFGMRPCDIAGVDKLDRVLLERPSSGEPTYRARRSDAFFVVVNCGVPASTCFCSSVDTGPHVDGRTTTHDLEVTELVGEPATHEPEAREETQERAQVGDGMLQTLPGKPCTEYAKERLECAWSDGMQRCRLSVVIDGPQELRNAGSMMEASRCREPAYMIEMLVVRTRQPLNR